MLILLAGLLLFLGAHSTRIVADDWRGQFIHARGEGAWKGLYTIVSLLGLVLIVIGYGQTRTDPVVVWNPPAAMAHLATLLNLVAFVLVAATYVPGNRLRARVGHPMVLGVKVWAVAHLLANGRLGDMLLFGAFLVWAVADFISCRKRDRQSGAGEASAAQTPDGQAIGSDGTRSVGGMARDVMTVAAGVIAWLVFALWLHRALIGVSPFG